MGVRKGHQHPLLTLGIIARTVPIQLEPMPLKQGYQPPEIGNGVKRYAGNGTKTIHPGQPFVLKKFCDDFSVRQ